MYNKFLHPVTILIVQLKSLLVAQRRSVYQRDRLTELITWIHVSVDGLGLFSLVNGGGDVPI